MNDTELNKIKAEVKRKALENYAASISNPELISNFIVTGGIGYLYYAAFTDNKTFDGRDMLPWSELPENIQGAWGNAAYGIVGETFDGFITGFIDEFFKELSKVFEAQNSLNSTNINLN